MHYYIKKRVEGISRLKNIIYTMYIIISTPKSPKNRPFFGKVFSEYFLRQTTNRHTILCGSVEVWKMKIAIFAPLKKKNGGNIGKFAEGSTNIRRRYLLDIVSISSREIITTILVNFDVN